MSKSLPHGVRIVVAYDGTEFAGWQRQPRQRTVQGVLEGAVHAITSHHVTVFAASRTDSGVHALGQVAAFACDRVLPQDAWVHELNAHLPDDVSVLTAEPCPPDYQPRFHGTSKRYRYLVRVGRIRDPLTRHRAWHIGPKMAKSDAPKHAARVRVADYLEVDAMRDAARRLLGEHDFRAFQASNDYRENTVRVLHAVDVVEDAFGCPELLAFEVQGNAFLKNMVRILAGTLVDVGRRRLTPEAIEGLLGPDARRGAAGSTAPAHGLTLLSVSLRTARTD